MAQQILIVGPNRNRTGGVSRYMIEQQRHLDSVAAKLYETGPASADSTRSLLVGVLFSLWRMLRFPFQARPDVVHVHSSFKNSFYRNSFYVMFGQYVWRRPVVFHVHGSSFDEFLQPESRHESWFHSTVLNAATRVIVLSPYWQTVLAEHVPEERIVVLPNAVPTDEYDPVTDGEPHVVFLSNLIERKGVTEFADAIDALDGRPDLPGFEVTVAGSGQLTDRVEKLAADHDTVSYLGYIDEAHKRAVLEEGTIYVLPTRAEGLPIVILEAMAAGTAIVSTPVGSIPEVVADENGRLVAPADAGALTETLATLLADSETVSKMGETNRQTAVENYSWVATATKLEELYATVGGVVSVRPDNVRSAST